MANPTVGQTTPYSIAYFDQHGAAMTVTPTPDATPVWTNTNAAAETLTPSADGLTMNALAIAAGADEIDLALSVGGVSFHALIAVTVVAEAQVLTSIGIVQGTPA